MVDIFLCWSSDVRMLDDALLINLWSRFKRSEPFWRNSSNQAVFIRDKIYILQTEGSEMIKYCLVIENYFPISCSVFSSPVRGAKLGSVWRCFMMFYSACQPEPSFTILEKLTEKSGRGNSLFISSNMLHRFSFVFTNWNRSVLSSNPNIISHNTIQYILDILYFLCNWYQ